MNQAMSPDSDKTAADKPGAIHSAEIGAKRRYIKGGELGSSAGNILDRNFSPDMPNQAWLSDIRYVRTYEGFLSVATVLGLFSRCIVGWSMDKNIDRHLVSRALMMVVWKRQPKATVLVHSDEGSRYSSADYGVFLQANILKISMSRRAN
jgi:putative transposase